MKRKAGEKKPRNPLFSWIFFFFSVFFRTVLKRDWNNTRTRYEPLLDKGLGAYWVYRKRLDHYWIQPEFVLILVLNKRLINGSIHNNVAACSAWIPYRPGTDYVTVGTDYKAEGRGKLQGHTKPIGWGLNIDWKTGLDYD